MGGKSDKVEGEIKEGVGGLTGDEETETEGEVQSTWGEGQEKWDEAKEKGGEKVDEWQEESS